MKDNNSLWNFFASVKLALFILCTLALTSIIGTIIPQNEPIEFYSKTYGPKTAQFLQIFDLANMYTSWWFLAFLGLLSANLIICSIDRFPGVWQQIKADHSAIPLENVKKMSRSCSFTALHGLQDTVQLLQRCLEKNGWRAKVRQREDTTLLFCEKGKWSRLGVYLVHTSILIIFLGAIYGQFSGFKGSIMLPELQASSIIYPHNNEETLELGFDVRCDRFDIEFYRNGMPKEYRSELTILKDGKELLKKAIVVNDPLQYNGITFYQSSYQGFRDFITHITEENGDKAQFVSEFQEQVHWSKKDLSFGIINLENVGDRVSRVKIWFSDGKGSPSEFWMNVGESVKIKRTETTYLFSTKQRYATGLQVAKDPGVWIVYFGFGLMLSGLFMAFFMSHKRIWLLVDTHGPESAIVLSASANKNKAGFAKRIGDLAEKLKHSIQ